ncbi:MAG: PAS domain-containing hybrid sensor histidine kinase/response regulator [Planctomycetota bacterium]|jgi:PAS domain S-box-containing protein
MNPESSSIDIISPTRDAVRGGVRGVLAALVHWQLIRILDGYIQFDQYSAPIAWSAAGAAGVLLMCSRGMGMLTAITTLWVAELLQTTADPRTLIVSIMFVLAMVAAAMVGRMLGGKLLHRVSDPGIFAFVRTVLIAGSVAVAVSTVLGGTLLYTEASFQKPAELYGEWLAGALLSLAVVGSIVMLAARSDTGPDRHQPASPPMITVAVVALIAITTLDYQAHGSPGGAKPESRAVARGNTQVRSQTDRSVAAIQNHSSTPLLIGGATLLSLVLLNVKRSQVPGAVEAARSRIASVSGVFSMHGDAERLQNARSQTLEAVLDLMATHQTSGRLQTEIQRQTKAVAKTLDVSGASLWLSSHGGKSLTCFDQYDRESNTHRQGERLEQTECQSLFDLIAQHLPFVSDSVLSDDSLQDTVQAWFAPEGISAAMCIPLPASAKVSGMVCVEHRGGSRKWTLEEQLFLTSATALISYSVERSERVVAERRASQLSSVTRTFAWELGVAGNVVSVSEQIREVLGYETKDVIGRNVAEFVQPGQEDELNTLLGRCRSGEAFRSIELPFVHRVEGTVWLRMIGTPISGEGGQVAGCRGLAADVSVSREAHSELERARLEAEAANRAKSEFLANMSHELRTPMTAILGFTDLLLDDREENLPKRERREKVKTIKRNGEYLLELINDILDLSKIEAGRFEVEHSAVEVPRLLTDIKTLMDVRAEEKNIEFLIEAEGSVPSTIQTDPIRFRQILINLIGNAIKFTEDGCVRVVVSCQGVDTSTPLLIAEIIDTGIGMSDSQISQLFRPFAQVDSSMTRKSKGTGLGLVISRRLTRMLGGDLEVFSEKGRGSTFRLSVATGPLQDVQMVRSVMVGAEQSAVHQVPSEVLLQNCRLLLVDDAPDNRLIISTFLKRFGPDISVAENGEDAIDHVLRALNESIPFDVVLMDMQMPVLDGYEATRRLRAEGYDGQIIALTAHAMAGAKKECLDAGCDAYATKPIVRDDLLKTIGDCLFAARENRKRAARNQQQGATGKPATEKPVTGPATAPAPQPTIAADSPRVRQDDRFTPAASDDFGRESAASGVIDPRVFDRQAAMERCGGSEEAVQEIAALFLENAPEWAALLDATELADRRRAAHTLGGAAANLGASNLNEASLEVERQFKSGGEADSVALARLHDEIARLSGILEHVAAGVSDSR